MAEIFSYRPALCYFIRVKRIYLSTSGQERLPRPEENSHFGIAKTELGPSWSGDAEDAYDEMWNRGWVRVVDYGNKVYAERYADGLPVNLTDLTALQRTWLDNQVQSGKDLFWNDGFFRLTAENRLGQVSEIVPQLK
ncbi:MAG TPA: hypothetical protein VFC44_23350 [Candidatus Saccharimonadales bacterium]|nr:hypothetical protein [Candidatus Saccharimonadales bacterium]